MSGGIGDLGDSEGVYGDLGDWKFSELMVRDMEFLTGCGRV